MMRAAYRVADVRAAEQALMAQLPDGALMQRAATGLARRCAALLADRFDRVYGTRVLLLVGSGDNGGDALYAGAALARRGALVEALLLNPERAHAGGLEAVRAAGGRVVDKVSGHVDLVVDGILGIGGRGGLRDAASTVVADASAVLASDGAHPPVVAVDVPSGIDVDTGAVEGIAVHADVTVTFGVLKPGLLVGAGAVHSGLVELVDIGLGPPPGRRRSAYRRWKRSKATGRGRRRATTSTRAAWSGSRPARRPTPARRCCRWPAHWPGRPGWCATPGRPPTRCASDTRRSSPASGSATRAGSRRGSAAAGSAPTTGPPPRCAACWPRRCRCASTPTHSTCSVDGSLAGRLRGRDAPTVVTPHDREFQRLAGHPPGADRVGDALELAAKLRAVVLLKGNRTIIATPDGRAYVNPTGASALATGGTGDVLAGLLGSLLAAGLAPETAALSAAYVHGMAGRLAAEDGPVTALDVAGRLRSAVRLLWEA